MDPAIEAAVRQVNREKARAYKERNRDKVAAAQRAYKERNRDKVAAYMRDYRRRRAGRQQAVLH